MHGACEKRHTHIEVVSLSFAHRIVRNSWKLSDSTYHSEKIIRFAGGGTASFRLNKPFSIASGLDFARKKFNKFYVFLALKYTSIKDLTEITGLNKQTKKQNRRRNTRTQTHTHIHTHRSKKPQKQTNKTKQKNGCLSLTVFLKFWCCTLCRSFLSHHLRFGLGYCSMH